MSLLQERIVKLDSDFLEHFISVGNSFGIVDMCCSIATGDVDVAEYVRANLRRAISDRIYMDLIFSSGHISLVKHFHQGVEKYVNVDIYGVMAQHSADFLEYVLKTKLYVITNNEIILRSILNGNLDKIKVVHRFSAKYVDEIMIRCTCAVRNNIEIWKYFNGDQEVKFLHLIELAEFYTRTSHLEQIVKINIPKFLKSVCHGRKYTLLQKLRISRLRPEVSEFLLN